MPKQICSRSVLITSLTLVTAVALVVGIALVGNRFRFEQESVTISGPEGDLAGVLTLPNDVPARGLVVMVHGDGPVEATQDDLYSPWFEGAADSGFATLSWSKPGVGGSSGDWLSQSLGDRAAEVSAALDWAIRRGDVPTQTIVLWGASQAGWVIPKVVSSRDDIDAIAAVGPAINWLQQGRFNLLAELEHDGADTNARTIAIADSNQTRELLDREAPYEDYLESTTSTAPMTNARWSFIMRNYKADAVHDLTASASRKIPVHLMVGTYDRNVDIAQTERVYSSIFGPLLTVTHFDGAHSLARPVMEENDVVGLAAGIIWPRALLAPGVIDDYSAFLSKVGR